jgi:peptide/nickel transport system permease protein
MAQHPGDPEALTPRVEVDFGRARAGSLLERHGEVEDGSEYDDVVSIARHQGHLPAARLYPPAMRSKRAMSAAAAHARLTTPAIECEPLMVRFVVRRVLWALVTLVLVVTIAFFAVNLLLPYDFAVGLGQRQGAIEAIREQLGLDRPLVVQWLDFLWDFVRGDLGESYDGSRVSTVVWGTLPTTVAIFAVGGVVAYLLGEWFGRVVAWSRNRYFGAVSSVGSVLLFTAFPPWLVFVLVYFGTDRLFQVRSWFGLGPKPFEPVMGGPVLEVVAFGLVTAFVGGIVLRNWARRNDRRALGWLAVPLGLAAFVASLIALGIWAEAIEVMLWPSAVMATVGLVLIAFGESMLVMRAGVSAEMTEDYVFTARAKALPERLIRDRHVAPNAVLPAISRLITSVPYLLSGLIIIERELNVGGVASLFFSAIESGNVPIIIGILAVVGIIGLVLRIVLDMIQAVIDPRIRAEGEPA